jgi:hypothetical protein
VVVFVFVDMGEWMMKTASPSAVGRPRAVREPCPLGTEGGGGW